MTSSRPGARGRGGSNTLCTPAWLLRGISSIPGRLRLRDSRLSFVADGVGSAWDWQLEKLERAAGSAGFTEALKGGRSATLFDEPMPGIGVRSPWYYFAGGLVLRVGGQRYRVSFGKPVGPARGDDELATLISMRQAGKRWLHALGTE